MKWKYPSILDNVVKYTLWLQKFKLGPPIATIFSNSHLDWLVTLFHSSTESCANNYFQRARERTTTYIHLHLLVESISKHKAVSHAQPMRLHWVIWPIINTTHIPCTKYSPTKSILLSTTMTENSSPQVNVDVILINILALNLHEIQLKNLQQSLK